MRRYGEEDGGFPPYVPVATRRRRALSAITEMRKAGHELQPVEIATRQLATSFWGKAWCKNLEAYSDFSNRLPRGRSYVRHGAVLDLRIKACRVHGLVSGSDLYTVDIRIEGMPQKKWAELKQRCASEIESLVELLQGSLSKKVMERVTSKGEGLLPSPSEISWSCSCPDWAGMCKHAAAAFYGIGARLDHHPELLFTLRDVDPAEMIEAAVQQPASDDPQDRRRKGGGHVIQSTDLSSIFGVDIESSVVESPSSKYIAPRKKVGAKKFVAKKTAKKAATKAGPTRAAKKKVATKTGPKRAVKKAATKPGPKRARKKAATKTGPKRAVKKAATKTGPKRAAKKAATKTGPKRAATRGPRR